MKLILQRKIRDTEILSFAKKWIKKRTNPITYIFQTYLLLFYLYNYS